MRRRTLDPPRPAAHGPVVHVPLDAPHEASPVPRPHFDPKRGWFRRIERATSLFLSRSVWPRCPGVTLPYGFILGRHLTVGEANVAVPGLPAAFDGTTLLFVSDVHAGPFLSKAAFADAFERLATLRPDVVIHGGDLATTNVAEAADHRAAITALEAPLGAFAVFGNHDHYTRDVAGVGALFESCGVRVLNNTAVALERGGARIALAGIDDWNFGRPHLARALADARELAPAAPVVLVSHNPDAFFEAAARGVALTLAGHTHGGQVRIPGRPVLVRMSRYRLDEGRYERDGSQIIVSRGLGVSGIPLRLFSPPEALLVTLRA
jgi:predicted MPP superfamily phosphohydrolase